VSFSKVFSVQNHLLNAQIVDVECDISRGMNRFDIVGLGDKAVEEAKERISAAIKNCGLESPKKDQIKTTISLAPAHIKKVGPIFDLAMALCFLKSSKQISFSNKERVFIGELALDGKIREVKGILPMVVEAKRKGFKEIYVPKTNAKEAALVSEVSIYPCEDLISVINHIDQKAKEIREIEVQNETSLSSSLKIQSEVLLEHIKGNENAKRAMVIALAGGHNICFYGPPGTGKTMLAKASKTLLPQLSFKEVLEVTSLYSVSGELKENIIASPPFRAPHHTSSHVSVVGGGTDIKPGEISLAHKGVLFLDEFPEFDRRVVNSLRQPLEEKEVKISRAKESAHLPADFILMISMNPCPCGYFGYDSKNCTCTMNQISKYQKKISGPIMDRIDIWIEVSAIDYNKLIEKSKKEEVRSDSLTRKAQEQIKNTRKFQQDSNREKIDKRILNGNLSTNQLEKILVFEEGIKEFFDESAERLRLSARSYTRILKVALTISQMNGDSKIKKEHILEALSWRPNSKFFV
jgi:magnesium chelatase family protein